MGLQVPGTFTQNTVETHQLEPGTGLRVFQEPIRAQATRLYQVRELIFIFFLKLFQLFFVFTFFRMFN